MPAAIKNNVMETNIVKNQYYRIPTDGSFRANDLQATKLMAKVNYSIFCQIERYTKPCDARTKLKEWHQELHDLSSVEAIKRIQDKSTYKWSDLEDLFGEILLNQIVNFK